MSQPVIKTLRQPQRHVYVTEGKTADQQSLSSVRV